MNSLDLLERAVSVASKEFVRGFIIGQVALFLLLLVLARILLFSSPTEVRSPQRNSSARKITHPQEDNLATLKRKLTVPESGNVETCFWFNLMAGRLFLDPLRNLLLNERNIDRISTLLSTYASVATDMLGPVEITRLTLGDTNPLIHSITTDQSGTGWEFRIEWPEAATVDLETSLVLPWPSNRPFACLPCSLALLLTRLALSLRLELDGEGKVRMSVMEEGLQIDVDIRSLIGHRSKLKDLPKVTSILQSRIRQALVDSILYPLYIKVDIGGEVRKALDRLVATRLPVGKAKIHED